MSDSAYETPSVGSFEAFARVIQRSTELSIDTAFPGVVKAVAQGVQGRSPATVDVLPSRQVVFLAPDGSEDVRDPQLVKAVVGQLRVPGFRITLPIQVGTQGWIFIADRSLDGWWSSNGEPTDPALAVTHKVGALFVPMGNPGRNALVFDAQDLVISTDTGAAQEPGEIRMDPAGNVTVEGPTINLGRNGTPGADAVALAQLVHQYLVSLIGAAAPAPMDGGTTMKASMTAFLQANPFTSMAANNVNGRR